MYCTLLVKNRQEESDFSGCSRLTDFQKLSPFVSTSHLSSLLAFTASSYTQLVIRIMYCYVHFLTVVYCSLTFLLDHEDAINLVVLSMHCLVKQTRWVWLQPTAIDYVTCSTSLCTVVSIVSISQRQMVGMLYCIFIHTVNFVFISLPVAAICSMHNTILVSYSSPCKQWAFWYPINVLCVLQVGLHMCHCLHYSLVAFILPLNIL